MAKTGLPCWLCGEEPFCQGRKHGFQEEPTCCGAIKPVHHAYGVCVPEPESRNSGVHVLQVLKSECPGACAPQ